MGSRTLDLETNQDLISIWAEKEKSFDRAAELSTRLKLPIWRTRPKTKLCLYVDKERLGLGFPKEIPFRPYYVDFCSREWRFRRRKGLSKNRLFLTALGIKDSTRILDLTAGFGQDAFMMAWAGGHVTAVERSPIVYEVLQDGLLRAFEEDSGWSHKDLIKIENAESSDFLGHADESYDVAYLDPMFDKPKKKSKSPKPMQLLQELLSEDTPSVTALFGKVRSHVKRVVVKLPLKGELPLPKPNVTFAGQSIRYDVYL